MFGSLKQQQVTLNTARTVVSRPKRMQRATLIIVVVLALALINAAAHNSQIDFSTIGSFLFDPRVLDGVRATVVLTIVSMAIGIPTGLVLAVMRGSSNGSLRAISWFYIWIFRGTPLLVQLILWYNLALVFPTISLTIPFVDVSLFSVDTNSVVTPLVAVVLALSLNEGAYMAEIMRSGITSVNEGQREAAKALGMTPWLTLRLVVLPQAIRTALPPTGSEVINMLKSTSLVSVVAYSELLTSVTSIYNQNFLTVELLIVASLWYLALCTILTIGQSYIERHFGRGYSAEQPRRPALRTFVDAVSPRLFGGGDKQSG